MLINYICITKLVAKKLLDRHKLGNVKETILDYSMKQRNITKIINVGSTRINKSLLDSIMQLIALYRENYRHSRLYCSLKGFCYKYSHIIFSSFGKENRKIAYSSLLLLSKRT